MCLAQGHNAVALEPTDEAHLDAWTHGEAWTHGLSVSSQALYHDSKSQSLNPENKLFFKMKRNPPAILSQ